MSNERRLYKNVLGYPTEAYAPPTTQYSDIIKSGRKRPKTNTAGGNGSVLLRKQFKDGSTDVDTGGEVTADVGSSPPAPTTYATILQGLEQQRQSAMQSAEAQYARSQASYGQMGDALNRQGLANSGYAAALDSAAYASMARSKDAAQTAYGQALADAELGRQAKYEDVLGKMYSGDVSADYAKKYGESYGFTTEQMKGVEDAHVSAVNDFKQTVINDPSYATQADIDAQVGKTLSDQDAAEIKTALNNSVYNRIDRIVKTGDFDNINAAQSDLDALYNNGNIDENTYNSAKQLFASAPALTAKYNAGSITTKEYVDGMVSEGAATVKADFVTSGKGLSGLKSGSDGSLLLNDDIDIELPNGEKFDLRTKSNSTVALAKRKPLNDLYGGSPEHNQIALYDGKLYAYSTKAYGWFELESDVDDINKAIAAILKYQQSKS